MEENEESNKPNEDKNCVQVLNYIDISKKFLCLPQISKKLFKTPNNYSKIYKQLLTEITKKRKRLILTFGQIREMTSKMPPFKPNSKTFPKLFFNILGVLQTTILALVKFNGDFEELNESFLEIVSVICFDMLRQGATRLFNTFEEMHLNLIQRIGKRKELFVEKEQLSLVNMINLETSKVLKSKFLFCEALFVLYEAVLISLNQGSKIVLSQEEKMYVKFFALILY